MMEDSIIIIELNRRIIKNSIRKKTNTLLFEEIINHSKNNFTLIIIHYFILGVNGSQRLNFFIEYF